LLEFLKIVVVFTMIILLLRRKVNLGLTMLLGALFLGIMFLLPPLTILKVAAQSAVDQATVNLIIVLVLIMFLENLMRNTGTLQKMVDSLKALIGDHRLVMGILPAFVGFLPSAGGARFSAPLVDQAADGLGLTAERKSFINYWYRHLWEYTFPVYPGLILASRVLDIPIYHLIAIQFPMAVLAVLVAIPTAFRGVAGGNGRKARTNDRWRDWLDLLLGIGPISVVIILVLAFKVDLVIALVATFCALLLLHRYSAPRVVSLVREAFSFDIVLLVVGVMIFNGVLEATGAVNALPGFFSSLNIPVEFIVFALPFIVGLLTGVTIAYVGVTFPILQVLVASGTLSPSLVAFAFVSGFAGVMLSPAHLCLVLTIQHFRADFSRVYRMLILPESLIVAAAAAFYLLVKPA